MQPPAVTMDTVAFAAAQFRAAADMFGAVGTAVQVAMRGAVAGSDFRVCAARARRVVPFDTAALRSPGHVVAPMRERLLP